MKIRLSPVSPKAFRSFRSFLPRRADASGFTLMELLVVIGIILALSGMLFPVMGGVRTAARRTAAASDCAQIAAAIKNFQVDYGRYPLENGDTANGLKDNETVVRAIIADETGDDLLNPRRVRYIEVKIVDSGVPPVPGGDGPASCVQGGEWFDPWGRKYMIFIDGTYGSDTSGLNVSSFGVTGVSGRVRGMEVGVGSKGPGEGTGASNYKQPVMSW